MIKETIENTIVNGVLPLCVYENTLHLYYEGLWHAFETAEEERLGFVKPLVRQCIGARPFVKDIGIVQDELKTEYVRLDGYVDKRDICINLKNSVLKLSKNGEITEQDHDQELGFRWKLNFSYDPTAQCPKFMEFLETVIGEKEAIDVLQEYLGYVLIPHSQLNLERALWLVGVGSNGKSVLTSLLKYLYGEENVSYLNLPELSDNEKRGMLKGKVLNLSQDATNRVDPSSYKTMVSGENIIFRELYKGSSVLKSVPKLVIATNELPRVASGIDAFMRRVILIPFNKVIKEEDRDLELGEKLKTELQGIFNFALEGLQRLLEQKNFTTSKLIDNAILDYRGELDALGDFLQDNPIDKIEVVSRAYISQNELYKKVFEWCRDNDRKNTYTSARKLRDKLVEKYGFSAYKNNDVYGIKGKWSDKNVRQHTPVNNTIKNPYADEAEEYAE